VLGIEELSPFRFFYTCCICVEIQSLKVIFVGKVVGFYLNSYSKISHETARIIPADNSW
jgi:hypothetical protein